MTQTIKRRTFLKAVGVGLGATALTCGGLTYVAVQPPTINFIEREGAENMPNKILIAYASKCGSTGEVANAIAEELVKRGQTVEVRLAHKVNSVNGYSAVMVGSAIRMGNWLPEALTFVEQNAPALQHLPTAFFTVHMLNTDDSAASRQARASYLDGVHKFMTTPIEVFFAGKLELAKMSWLDRFISTAMKAHDEDKRDWNVIRSWAQTIWA